MTTIIDNTSSDLYMKSYPNWQVTVNKNKVDKDKLIQSGICIGFDPKRHPAIRLIGKKEHLLAVIKDYKLDVFVGPELVPTFYTKE